LSGAPPEGTKIRKFLLIVWLVDSAALVAIFAVILLQGHTPDRIDLAGDLGAIWGGIAGFLIWSKWKARKQNNSA
jgi:hypothetical protein